MIPQYCETKNLQTVICNSVENIRYSALRLYLTCSVKAVAVASATYKSPNTNYGPIWLDGTNCTGTETSIGLCGHNPWGTNDCDHTEDIGVACQTSK